MRRIRKTLIVLLLGLSSCALQQHKCPDDEEILKAAFRIYSASEMIESDKEADHKLARTMYCVTSEYYFTCSNGDETHKAEHYRQAEEKAASYFGFDKEKRRKFADRVKKIKEEIASTVLKK